MSADVLVFAGMQGMTGLDFPGLVSAIVFTQGCNFRCPYCHNAHLIVPRPPAPGLSEEDALAFLEKRKGLLDGLVISGGEPTIQPGLAAFCRSAKELGYKIKLDTNGSRPQVVRDLLENGLVDYVALDCKTLPKQYHPQLSPEEDATGKLLGTLAVLKAFAVEREFRTTCVAPFVSEETICGLAGLLGNDAPWFLQKANVTESMRRNGLAALPAAELERLAGVACGLGARVSIR